MNDVLAALMADNDADREKFLNREVLRHAVMRQITCERTGQVLDVRTAVMVTWIKGDSRSAVVVTGEAWDEVGESVRAKVAELGAELEVIDGREL
ncbi:hypothetical protein ACIBOV_22865 [Micromonospora chersina]|uniref:hypothetical protein n=1 Tax=Micromonospora TaxID=1873 RepID=UPI0021C88728|nr:hypothetical protein [Micromonospora sp. MA102]